MPKCEICKANATRTVNFDGWSIALRNYCNSIIREFKRLEPDRATDELKEELAEAIHYFENQVNVTKSYIDETKRLEDRLIANAVTHVEAARLRKEFGR